MEAIMRYGEVTVHRTETTKGITYAARFPNVLGDMVEISGAIQPLESAAKSALVNKMDERGYYHAARVLTARGFFSNVTAKAGGV